MLDEEVRFLRKAHKIDNAYVDPVVEDIRVVPVTSIKVVFPRPVDVLPRELLPVNLEHYRIK